MIPKSHPFFSHEQAEEYINTTIEALKKCNNETSTAHTWVICEDDNVVGFTTIWVNSTKTKIISIYVSANYQKKGYGTKLLKKVFSEYKEAPYSLAVYKENKDAYEFYKKRGFHVDTPEEIKIDDDHEYLLMKRN
ncbi:GNAT family N-acetyltransferase [Nostoc commune]|uniref:GNAT family N-acetyltransferase n=1 Tax=Nostoc commune TaxID=1178 RepID=UPI0018C5FBA2